MKPPQPNWLSQQDVAAIRRGIATGRRTTGTCGAERVSSPLVPYGDVEIVTATGRATCKACRHRIAKGTTAYRLHWDFGGCGSWTAQEIHIHQECPV